MKHGWLAFCRITFLVGAVLGISASLQAGTIGLGASGWTASWDPSLDGLVDIQVSGYDGTNLFIQKSAEFTQEPNVFGQFPSIPIVFRQVAPSTLASIVIEDEILTNSTGSPWLDFHFDLLNEGDVLFRDGPGFFFTTSPLDNQHFSVDRTSFWVDGFGLGPGGSNAFVPTGTTWFPGDGASDGDLVIDVLSQSVEPYTVFTLKETPTPEPATLALVVLGVAAVLRRNSSR